MKRNLFTSFLAIAAMSILTLSCTKTIPSDLSKENITPKPNMVTPTGEYFTVKAKTGIMVAGSDELVNIGQYLASKIETVTGFSPAVSTVEGEPRNGNIFLTIAIEFLIFLI